MVGDAAANPIEEARQFVFNRVQEPALASKSLPLAAKAKVRSTNVWLSKFRRVGDLVRYLRRFESAKNHPVYTELKSHGLPTFEDIAPEFERKFTLWLHDSTRPSDFVIGEQYGVYDLLIFANVYDTRAGGMFVIKSGEEPAAVLIKATLRNGRYPNQWLSPGVVLKYFLKAVSGSFGEHFEPNAAILNIPGIPILTFVRDSEREPFTYFGIFGFQRLVREKDESKWFELSLAPNQPPSTLEQQAFYDASLASEVARSLAATSEERRKRLQLAPKKPRQVSVVSKAFVRNPDVIAEALCRAAGVCEICQRPAPFLRPDGSPYLEVHHVKPLAQGGDDTLGNAVAVCPNCHREAHFGRLAKTHTYAELLAAAAAQPHSESFNEVAQ